MPDRFIVSAPDAAAVARVLAGQPLPEAAAVCYQEDTAELVIGNAAGVLTRIPMSLFTAAQAARLGFAGSAVIAKEVTFTETAGAGTYSGSVVLPAGATLVDIIIQAVALWTNAGTAALECGLLAGDLDGFYTAVDLKATDLLANESISFGNAGGVGGAFLDNSHVIGRYAAAERTVLTSIVTASTGGGAGRTRMVVLYTLPTAGDIAAATKA